MRTVLVLVALAAAVGCNEEKKLLDQAKEEHAEGHLDKALTTLERVKEQAPGSDEERESRKLAEKWLIAAADAERSPHAARVRLDQALAWQPTSGSARARVCKLLVEGDQLDKAAKCLDEQLTGLDGVPTPLVADARKALKKKRDAQTAAERKKLLASPSVHHWEALVERFPGLARGEARQGQGEAARLALRRP